ncbi:carbohydrate ABC transporter permease [Propioniciclava flava]
MTDRHADSAQAVLDNDVHLDEGGAADVHAVRRRGRVGSTIKSVIKHVLMIAAALLMIYPLLWMLVSSFRPTDEIFRESGLVLTGLHTENYTEGWNALQYPFGHYLLNSVILVLGCILGNVISCSLAAYAFARLKFKFKNIFFGIMLLTDHAAHPRHHRSAIHHVLPVRLAEHVPSLDFAKAPRHGRLLRLLDGAIHSRIPAGAG